jgi:hypothetical protein
VLGYVAALRGDRSLALAQREAVSQLFTTDRGRVTINELGFVLRSSNVLSGRPGV